MPVPGTQTLTLDPAKDYQPSGGTIGAGSDAFYGQYAGPFTDLSTNKVGAIPDGTLRGSTEEIVEKLAAFAAIGIEHFTFWTYPSNIRSIERLAPIVEAAHAL